MSVRSSLPLLVCAASVACAPATSKTGDTSAVDVELLEAFVNSNYSLFRTVEEVAAGAGIDLESDSESDWPEGGTGEASFGSSFVLVDFSVDRTDFSSIRRVWSVSLDLDPLMAGGQATEGSLVGTWTYWEEVEGDPSQSWVQLELSGQVNHSGTAGEAETELFAIVNGNGEIWQSNVILGDETYEK